MIWSSARSLTRVKLSDQGSKIWTDDELLKYSNEVVDDLVVGSEAYLKTVAFPLTSSRTYAVPPDLYEIRSVRVNGIKIYGASPGNMEDLDAAYMTTTGNPTWYYLEGNGVFAFYPISDGDSSPTTFASEFGEIVRWNDGTSNYSVTDEFGVVVSIVDTTGAGGYFFDSYFGVVLQVTDGDVGEIEYVYKPQDIVNDSDVPDMPEYMQYGLIYGIVAKSLMRDGPGQNVKLGERYQSRLDELKKEWFARSHEWARGQNQMLSQQPVDWGSDLAWRQRVFP